MLDNTLPNLEGIFMHSFDPQIAQRVGINAAVIYQNIVWWCEKNAANERHIHEGRSWTYNSIKAFDALFPYLTSKQIRTALDKLETDGLILSGTFNKAGYDRTKWYCPSRQMDLPKKANGIAPKGEPIPVIKPVDKPDDINIDHFEDFWSAYPRKIGKGNARRAFAKAMKNATIEEISSGLNRQLAALSSKEQQYIPHASTWLNGERWNDEPDQSTSKPRNSSADTTAREIAFAARAGRSPSLDSF
jgi:hypothetical protein